MIWLFHRHGEYLSCEVRTCLQNAGFELLIARSGRIELEWYPDERQIERRWEHLHRSLHRDGWGEMYGTTGDPVADRGRHLRSMPSADVTCGMFVPE